MCGISFFSHQTPIFLMVYNSNIKLLSVHPVAFPYGKANVAIVYHVQYKYIKLCVCMGVFFYYFSDVVEFDIIYGICEGG